VTQDTRQVLPFPELFAKPVVATFDQPDNSSDGGAALLKAVDSALSLTESAAPRPS
jgi:hypothetical protein